VEVKKKNKNIMNKTRKIRLIIASIFFTVILMAFTPFGSFNPQNSGFWSCIIGGGFWYLMLYLSFSRFSSKN